MANGEIKVRDKLWIWGHEANSHLNQWNITTPSRMTPAEAALYLGVPNVVMVRFNDRPAPPFDQQMIALRPFQQVVWSVVGAGGRTHSDEVEQVCRLAARFPNLSGAIMDDFFHTPDENGKFATFTPEESQRIREQLRTDARRLDLWVVLYDFQLDLPFEPYFEQCDVTTFWTWRAEDLSNLERNFEKLESKMPDSRKVLGIYMYDYGDSRIMPVERMQAQCELGLRWLREGRIEGMIFLASCIGDLELEAVEWTRGWIAQVGEGSL